MGFFNTERVCKRYARTGSGFGIHFHHSQKRSETMDDHTLKANYMQRDISNPESPGKKPWQTPALTEVDYSETRGGMSGASDGGGMS